MPLSFSDNEGQAVLNLKKQVNRIEKDIAEIKDIMAGLRGDIQVVISQNMIHVEPILALKEAETEPIPKGKVACPVCGKFFSERGLKTHIRIHKE